MTRKMHNAALGLLMKKPLQGLLLPLGRPLNPEKWIFVVGCYDSGTTLLATILGHLPGFGGLPNEGQFLTDMLPYPETHGWPRMFCQCLDKLGMNGAGEAEAERIRRQWSIWYPKDARYLVEKSITGMIRMEFLQKHFPNAYFIHIIRDGYAVAKGIQRNANMTRWGTPYDEYPIEMCARQWLVADDVATEQAGRLEHYLPVYYEDFAENTGKSMRRIMEFLGIESNGAGAESGTECPDVGSEVWRVHGMRSTIVNMNDREYRLLSEQDVEIIGEVAREGLERHGYAPPEPGVREPLETGGVA
ncbi:sulfotransferase family protein [Salidesulfovibrio brasiliensis]|uniref:sulfotransferase family protein n=1 Tax=Salidesulfovibrio brasiliensis TaxID=221711 RepID=UPI00155D8F6F|nr:sulfotransferase [Salidesulfovibrio brasiliensis]